MIKTIELPTFIIAGAQKSGTTSLHHYLKSHQSVFFPERPQELHFFDMDEEFRKGLDYYKRFFLQVEARHAAVGQTSPLYIYESKAAQRMAALLPQVKLIFILRNPVDRAYSHYWHSVKKGYETLTFEEALAQEPVRIGQGFQQRRRFSYISRGYYAHQLERYLQHFSRKQILILLTEMLGQDPVGTIDKCCDFLDIDRQGQQIVEKLPQKQWNSSGLPRSQLVQRLTAPWRTRSPWLDKLIWKIDRFNLKTTCYSAMDPNLRAKLEALFVAENERLSTLFETDLSAWS